MAKSALDRLVPVDQGTALWDAMQATDPPEGVLASPVPGVTLTETGAQFPEDLSELEWVQVGRYLHQVGQVYQWCVADWIRFGQRKYGEKYREAVERTGFRYSTLANWVSVAEQVDFSRRRENLPFSHHAEVAVLPPRQQEALLTRATKEGWTVRQLREASHKARRAAQHIEAPPDPHEEAIVFDHTIFAAIDRLGWLWRRHGERFSAREKVEIRARLMAVVKQIKV